VVDKEAKVPLFIPLAIPEVIVHRDVVLVAVFLPKIFEVAGLIFLDENHTLSVCLIGCDCKQSATTSPEIGSLLVRF
jgi:hypothetical protein